MLQVIKAAATKDLVRPLVIGAKTTPGLGASTGDQGGGKTGLGDITGDQGCDKTGNGETSPGRGKNSTVLGVGRCRSTCPQSQLGDATGGSHWRQNPGILIPPAINTATSPGSITRPGSLISPAID